MSCSDLAVKIAGNRAIIEPRTDAGRAFTASHLAPFKFSNGVHAFSPDQQGEFVDLVTAAGVTFSAERVI